ncbi:RICIN domain-containing protein [Streptomyces litmocidini]|uniref:RICIN domain-containing protein n=1 Tax=Streptomyces litmocidini TaxID=67318 RepID=A0ABW7U5Q0_9ACTN
MTTPVSRSVALVAAAALAAVGGALAVPSAAAVSPTATYTVTVGAKGSWTDPDDTPASPYVDKDGTFYFQQAHALYGANEGRRWSFYTGGDHDTATRSGAISDAVNPANSLDRNNDTTWRCNNSPTGVEATQAPAGSSYAHRNYCDLTGMWVDPDTGDWYGLVHNEFTPQPFGDTAHFDGIDYAVSKDQGRTWTVKGHVITSPYSTKRGDTTAFPQQTYHYGTGDPRLFVDTASGYFYAFYGSRIVNKGGGWAAFYGHVARAPISGKMAPGSWQKWYGGSWSQPGVGGRESTMVPVGAGNTTGYVPTAKEYDPAHAGSVAQQVAAGLTPATSPLFVMDITYNAYLGLYIGEPQAVDQSGNASQELYATDDLTTQKWFRLGDTGGYKNASWYRWFLDSRSKTGSGVTGKDFRSYCSFGCSNGSSSEYVNLTIGTNEPAAPVDTTKTYRIAGAGGRVLAQVAGGSATTSTAAATGSALESWIFTAKGDGSYRIANSSTGQLLGVDSTGTAGRAWGAKPTVTAAGTGGSTVGQEWFVIRGASAADNAPTGTLKLVNRYSGLVIGLSGDATRLAETTPVRAWTDTTGSAVGAGRTAGEQSLTLTATGTAPAPLTGIHTLTTGGKALDNPNSSTADGTQLITWTPNGGNNQKWTFTQQPDGSYEIRNSQSGKCADIENGSTGAGARVIQWTCHGGGNQRWNVVRQSSGTYGVASVLSGLSLTSASTTDGAAVTQQPDTGGALQRWTIN